MIMMRANNAGAATTTATSGHGTMQYQQVPGSDRKQSGTAGGVGSQSASASLGATGTNLGITTG